MTTIKRSRAQELLRTAYETKLRKATNQELVDLLSRSRKPKDLMVVNDHEYFPQISFKTLYKDEGDHSPGWCGWHFNACIASDIEDACHKKVEVETNYDAHKVLKKNGVIPKNAKNKDGDSVRWDHESGCCYYTFTTRKAAERFVEKYNKFMKSLHDKFDESQQKSVEELLTI